MRHVVIAIFAALIGLSTPALAQEPVGVVERIKGEAYRTGDAGFAFLAVGDAVFEDDVLETAPYARMLVRFEDGSALTLGEDARLTIDDMVYRRDAASDRQALSIAKGVFRFLTGAMATANPQSVTFRTPVATIGVRGTNFGGGELFVGMPPGVAHYGFQLQDGAIEVRAPEGTVILDEAGEGTFLPIGRTAPPTPPRQWSQPATDELEAALAF
ncbi:MAG: FecR family protein [Pseudomonadota bacterium]